MLDIINQIGFHESKEFAAPIPTRHTTRVFSLQSNIPYWFKVNVEQPGWYLLNPVQKNAHIIKELQSYERLEYLEQLKRFYVITLFPINDTTWMVTPFNLSDAEQRGWSNGTPRMMHITTDILQSYQTCVARQMGSALLYHEWSGLSLGLNNGSAYKHAVTLTEQRLEAIQKIEKEKLREERLLTEKGRIESSLNFMDAKLIDWERNIQGYEITWEHNGQTHTMTLDTNLRIRSAGVCLAGTDSRHSLSSIVAVMEDRDNDIGW